MKIPEEIFESYLNPYIIRFGVDIVLSKSILIKMIKQTQYEAWNEAIEDATDNAEIEWFGEEGNENARVNKESILKLRKIRRKT